MLKDKIFFNGIKLIHEDISDIRDRALVLARTGKIGSIAPRVQRSSLDLSSYMLEIEFRIMLNKKILGIEDDVPKTSRTQREHEPDDEDIEKAEIIRYTGTASKKFKTQQEIRAKSQELLKKKGYNEQTTEEMINLKDAVVEFFCGVDSSEKTQEAYTKTPFKHKFLYPRSEKFGIPVTNNTYFTNAVKKSIALRWTKHLPTKIANRLLDGSEIFLDWDAVDDDAAIRVWGPRKTDEGEEFKIAATVYFKMLIPMKDFFEHIIYYCYKDFLAAAQGMSTTIKLKDIYKQVTETPIKKHYGEKWKAQEKLSREATIIIMTSTTKNYLYDLAMEIGKATDEAAKRLSGDRWTTGMDSVCAALTDLLTHPENSNMPSLSKTQLKSIGSYLGLSDGDYLNFDIIEVNRIFKEDGITSLLLKTEVVKGEISETIQKIAEYI